MKQLSSLLAAFALTGTVAFAQAPAAPATPAAPAAAPAATTPAAPGEKKKPYSGGDVQKIKEFGNALQFHLRMGEMGKWKFKDDKELGALAGRIQKESADYYTPLVNLAQAHQMPDKDIPNAVSNSDKSAIEKLNKEKPDKWTLEYLELFSKEAKKNFRVVDGAARAFSDPELKDLAMRAAKIFEGQAEALESRYKELKNPKKEVKK